MFRLIVSVAALTVVAASIAGCRPSAEPRDAAQDEQIVPVAVRRAELGNSRAVLHAGGIITPAPDAEFIAAAPEPARIIEILKSEGDMVASGEPLVRLELPSTASELARARADVAAAQATLENARVAQARARELAERGLVARREAEDADAQYATAQQALAVAERARTVAEEAAARGTVRARFAGRVTRRLHNPGDLARGPDDPILHVIDPSRLEVVATVPVRDVAKVVPGATARIASSEGEHPQRLTVVSIAARRDATATTDTAAVRLSFTEPTALAVDTPVQVDIDLGERANSVLIPAEAIVRDAGKSAVFVVREGVAERREVTIGVEEGTRLEITSGVRPGDVVITRGQTGLAHGARVSAEVGR